MFDITQAYGQYASGPFTVMAGKFTTLHGTEVIWSPSNNNFSRSMLFGAVPFTHTGVRAVFAANDIVSLTAGVNNGWDQLADTNRGKTTELGITVTPIKTVSIVGSYYGGQENSANTATAGRRDSYNLVASWTIIEPLTIGGEYLRVQQKDAIFDAGGALAKATYSGYAVYLSYLVMPKFKVSVRGESFDDKDAVHFGMPGASTTGGKYKEGTLTLAYLPADAYEVRGEIRQDRSNQQAFTGDNGSFSKNLTTFAVQVLYKF
jgi:hypothetical protein